MNSTTLPKDLLDSGRRDDAMHQAVPGVRKMSLLSLPTTVLENHLMPAVHQAGVEDVFARTSPYASRLCTQWRLNRCFKEIEAGLILKAPEDPDEPVHPSTGGPCPTFGALGRQGAALNALPDLHVFFGIPEHRVDLYGLNQKPAASSAQLLAHVGDLRAGAKELLDAGSWSKWVAQLTKQQIDILPQGLQALREHCLLPLSTWASENGLKTNTESMATVLLCHAIYRSDRDVMLTYENLRTPPPLACYFSSLRVIRLSGNQLVEFPREIVLFDELEELELSHNGLDALPDELEKLQKITELELEHNAFRTLPPVLSRLNSLQLLTLHDNAIVDVADGYRFAPSLKSITVDNASLAQLAPAMARSSGLKEVTVRCRAEEQQISVGIGALHGVETLSIWTQSATTLPSELGNLRSLRVLIVYGENLRQLPQELGALQELEILELHARTLLELPQSISQCQKLRLLDLRETNVNVRPLQTFSMPNLVQVLVARRR